MVDATGVVPGKVIHKLAELFFKSGCQWEVFDDKIQETFEHYINKPYVFLSKNAFASSKDEAWNIISKYKDNFVAELQRQGFVKNWTISEGRFGDYENPFKITPDIGLTGGWDLLTGDSKNDPLTVVDFKASDSLYYLDRRQLFFYALGIERFFGVTVSSVAFLLFKRKHTEVFHFSNSDRKQVIEWIKDGAIKVNTKQFNPTPSKYACGLCPFRTVCKYVFKPNPDNLPEGPTFILPKGQL